MSTRAHPAVIGAFFGRALTASQEPLPAGVDLLEHLRDVFVRGWWEG